MRDRGEKEVEKLCRKLWPAGAYAGTGDHFDMTFTKVPEGYDLTLKKMYGYVEVRFKHLAALAAFFGTREVNDSRYANGGCETCDYGSSYEVTFHIREDRGTDEF